MEHWCAADAALPWSAMTKHTPGIPLGAWLADLPDEQLIRLLELRPDLTQPPPGGISALAARAQARQSVKAATDDLDFLRLAVLDGLLALHANVTPVPYAEVVDLIGDRASTDAIAAAVMSFGFKYGVPLDADFVLDMRFLPNPFWVPELRAKSGIDTDVADYVLGQAGATEFLDRAIALFDPVLAGYQREGRRYVTLAIGCTGGKHRSVAVTEALAARFDPERVVAFVVHRDLGRE